MARYSIREINIAERIIRAEKDLFDFKSSQGIGGRTLATKEVIGPKYRSQYSTIFGVTQFNTVIGYVVFEADNQLNPHAQLYLDFFMPDGSTLFDPTDNDDGPQPRYFFPIPQPPGSKTAMWRVESDWQGPVGPNQSYFLRPSVAATDTGTLYLIDENESTL